MRGRERKQRGGDDGFEKNKVEIIKTIKIEYTE